MKKHVILFILFILYSVTLSAQIAQLQVFHKKCINSRIEKNDVGTFDFCYYNDDCIDYVLVRKLDQVYALHPGKNVLARLSKDDLYNNPWKTMEQKIKIFPGRINKQEKLKPIVYALPVKNGKQVKCISKETNIKTPTDTFKVNTVQFRMNPGDTIYAVRSGVVCQDVPNNTLYVYHDDGSIAVYRNIKKSVNHKDRVIAGQSIGAFVEDKKALMLQVLCLSSKYIRAIENLEFPYTGLAPVFRTTEGDITIDKETIVTANTDDELVMQEMTSKEKKTYKK